MKQFWRILIKSLLVITGIALLLLLIAGLVLVLDWPWWTGSFFILLIFGVAIGVLLVRKIINRRKEQQFVDQIISQDDLRLKAMADKERDESQLLQARWKEAIETLKKSHLKKLGNPLYVLPWYMVIGESASGKTTAIKSARLSSPFAEATNVSGVSGTRNCDWWFFEQAIIIDTAGRYAIRVNEERDKEEWRQFLSLLTKFRKKEPLNGLIVTVPANKLLEGAQDELEREGLQIRSRIDEIMLTIGSKFPVYVMVTKCDLIKGMTHFCDKLPEKVVNQAMGVVNPQHLKVTPDFWLNAVDTISDRVGSLLLRVLHDSKAGKLDPALILFPSEFARLRNGVNFFMSKAFQDNPYQETPILRGLFFTSGRQEGTPYSHFLHKLGLLGEKEVLPGTNRGLFLHDFFARILPMDRGIFAPTRRAIEWTQLTRNLGLTSWVALLIALCGLMSFAFVKNLDTMREVPKEFQQSPAMKGDLLTDVVTLDRYQQAILQVEERNRNWWIPRFGLTESIELEKQLKDKFCQLFRASFLTPLDKKISDRLAAFQVSTPEQTVNRHVSHLIRRINILKKRLQSRDLEGLNGMPQVPFLIMLTDQLPQEQEVKGKIDNIYAYYLHWNQDDGQITQEKDELQKWLLHILAAKGNQLDWLIQWANDQDDLKPVVLGDFWGGTRNGKDQIKVSRAFTRKGKELIDGFLVELEAVLPDPGPSLIAGQKADLEKKYRQAFFREWQAFASGFDRGIDRLAGHGEWLTACQQITSLSGPYLALLDRMMVEVIPVAEGKNDAPGWANLTIMYPVIRGQIELLGKTDSGSMLVKAGEKSLSLIDKVEKKFDTGGAEKGAVTSLENQRQAARALQEYQKALQEITPQLSPRKSAYDMAAAVFKDEKNPLATARQSVARLKNYMATGKKDDETFWKLLNSPLDLIWDFQRNEAGCYLQDRWEKDVMVEVQGVNDPQKVMHILLDQDGFAHQFVKGPAAPFISRNPNKGYYAVQSNGQIAFNASFLNFLTRGVSVKKTVLANYDVAIKGLPTDANPDAHIKPHATHLELKCAAGDVKLDNFQFPVVKNFKWTPDTCGDVVLDIEISNLVLTKKYEGAQAFPAFLQDFKTGRNTFSPDDFPVQKDELQRLGIKHIEVNYEFTGNKPIFQLQEETPGQVPSRIVKCWD
ncbi:MAG: type VI secretion system protein ImpL [Deltaproteobacteria bacterium]|nr:type VI secretion system protein ImpL [Deltaproteobacteria bacterium]